MTTIIEIPVARLSLAKDNVRRSNRDVDVEAMANDIAAHGLLQNLIVEPLKKPGHYSVKAGGRRLRALQRLIERGELPADHKVHALVLDDSPHASEASLAENFQRLPMNPADESAAFGALIARGATPDEVATRFGVTRRFVEGRIRLADLAKPVFEALAKGAITLGVAQAYAAVPDTERQARVFAEVGASSYYANYPEHIRRAMLGGCARGDDPRARFVGREAYLAAGGRIECELFDDQAGESWLDAELLEELASDKLAAEAQRVAAEQGIGTVQPFLGTYVPYEQIARLHRVYPERGVLSDDARARLAAIEAEADTLIAQIEDEALDDETRTAAEERLNRLGEDAAAVEATRPVRLPENANVIAFLHLDRDGKPMLHEGFFTSTKPQDTSGRETDPGDADDEASDEGVKLSQSLANELAMQRRAILARAIANDHALALDLAVFALAASANRFSGLRYSLGTTLSGKPAEMPIVGFNIDVTPAGEALASIRQGLTTEWMDAPTADESFDRFRALDDVQKLRWLAATVANSLEASANTRMRPRPFHDHLGRMLGIDVAAAWRPTSANYFGRVKKSALLATLEEIGGPTLAARYKASKKAEIARACEMLCAGRGIVEADVRERAVAWVPEAIRFDGVDQGYDANAWSDEENDEGGSSDEDAQAPDELTSEAETESEEAILAEAA